MKHISPSAIASLAIVFVVSFLALLGRPDTAAAQSHTATRSFEQEWASPGSELRVAITAGDYGPIGQVVEELPEGFTFVGGSLDDAHVEAEGRTVRFNLLGETDFSYTVRVPDAEGLYTFSGVIKNVDRDERAVGGQTTLRVGPPPTPTPTPTPEPTPTPTPEPTPIPTSTPTPSPTPTPTATPTATATPASTATPVPTFTREPTHTATPEPAPTREPTTTATPTPTVTPTPEPAATAAATPEPTPIPTQPATPTPEAETPEPDDGTPIWLWLFAIIAFIGLLLVAYVFLRRRL